MNRRDHRRLSLAARNEGKIKSYESCVDVRAWSHDIQTRNLYLRDWIKCDMPVCVVPVCTLNSILSVMTCSSRGGRVTPRCNSRCESKVLIDRLCSSCTVLKDCLSNNKEFEKYFREEEIETNHWPCEKCLEILKSIKMLWKIISEKVLNINLPKPDEFKSTHISSIRNITKEWQKEMVEEALFVKSNSILINQNDIIKTEFDRKKTLDINRQNKCINNNRQSKATETGSEFRNIATQSDCKSVRQKISKCTSANIKTVHLECKSQNNKKENEVIMIYKNNIQNLRHDFNVQKDEVDRLKKENVALNVELQHYRQNCSKNLYNCEQFLNAIDNSTALVSSPFESKEEYNCNTPEDIDSEMIITLKNCKNENFKHISVIQVLHKTNELNLAKINGSYFEKDDPVHILNKVQKTFKAMVNREMSIANKVDKSFENKNVVIKSSFRNICESRSAPSSSIYSLTSDSNFESANETVTIRLQK